jgi:alpha/beta superfamily hydrolase
VISELVTLTSSDGLELEAVLDADGSPTAVLLLCHPHPQMGGTMNAPLLLALRDELIARHWAVMRFNFRGIGRSQGGSGTGDAEAADVRAAAAFLWKRFPEMPLALGGWSFGAAVAVRMACKDDGPVACFAIAPPVTAKPGVTVGLPPPDECNMSCPLLVVVGANDDQISPPECRAWTEQVRTATYIEMSGANHFFWAKYDALTAAVADFLDEALEKEA